MLYQSKDFFKFVISHAKSYGFIFPSSEIYDGLNSIYDYGQNGVILKNKIKEYWWKSMVQLNKNIVGIDSSILMHPNIWKASGHIDLFNDLFIDNKDTKHRYRVDVLINKYIEKHIQNNIKNIIFNARKDFGKNFDEEKFVSNNKEITNLKIKKKKILNKFSNALKYDNLLDIRSIIDELKIEDPNTGSKNWTKVRKLNLMFQTEIGSKEDSYKVYLRPETAQGIFVNFLNIQKTGRMKIPFGIAQIGKSFRNEIIARQFIFRMREFEQMEMQFFIEDIEYIKWYEHWKDIRMKWHLILGLGDNKYKFNSHKYEKLSHYNNLATDIEFLYPFGFKELEGIHYRTNFDLKNHEIFSKKKIKYFDSKKNIEYIPHVIETSIGLDRMFLAVLSSSLHEEKLENGKKRLVLKLPSMLAPIEAAILPLVKKDGLPEFANKIFETIKIDHQIIYDDSGSIGKRYRRQDAIGTPICITIDYDTLLENTVTVRFRNTMKQKRYPINMIQDLIKSEIDIKNILCKMI